MLFLRTTRKSTPTLFYVSLLLLAAVLCTSHLTSGLYARYATSATASDSAQVASFRVSDLVDGKEAQTLTVSAGLQPPVAGSTSDPGEDPSSKLYAISVENDSNIAVNYVVIVENLTGNLPLDFGVKKDTQALSENDDGEFVIAIGVGETANFTLTMSWQDEKLDPELMGQVDLVEITLLVEQITVE